MNTSSSRKTLWQRTVPVLAAGVLSLTLTGCASDDGYYYGDGSGVPTKTGVGALAGAAGGAAIGGAVGGSQGAIIGAGSGAAVGAVGGNAWGRSDARRDQNNYYDNNAYSDRGGQSYYIRDGRRYYY